MPVLSNLFSQTLRRELGFKVEYLVAFKIICDRECLIANT